jgi:hypothetical protein
METDEPLVAIPSSFIRSEMSWCVNRLFEDTFVYADPILSRLNTEGGIK